LRYPKWVEGDKEDDEKHTYKISKIEYECHNYDGGRTGPRHNYGERRELQYNIGIFVYLQEIEEGSVIDRI